MQDLGLAWLLLQFINPNKFLEFQALPFIISFRSFDKRQVESTSGQSIIIIFIEVRLRYLFCLCDRTKAALSDNLRLKVSFNF